MYPLTSRFHKIPTIGIQSKNNPASLLVRKCAYNATAKWQLFSIFTIVGRMIVSDLPLYYRIINLFKMFNCVLNSTLRGGGGCATF